MARNPMTPFRPGGGLVPGDPILSLHRQMNRLFDDVFRGAGLSAAETRGQGGGTFVNASMSVSETEKEIRITAELPGVTEQDIDIASMTMCSPSGGEEVRAHRRQGELPLREALLRNLPALLAAALPGGSGAGASQLREWSAHGDGAEDRSTGARAPIQVQARRAGGQGSETAQGAQRTSGGTGTEGEDRGKAGALVQSSDTRSR